MSPPPSAAMALRESFGDRKLPEISRKISACVPCRKLKIKCNMAGSQPPCARCKSRGLACTVNKSLQTLLESDAAWKEQIERRIEQIEQTLKQAPSEGLDDANFRRSNESTSQHSPDFTVSDLASANEQTDSPNTVALDLSCSLGAFPASSIMKSARGEAKLLKNSMPDLIECGILSQRTAEQYFAFYRLNLDQNIHQLLEDNDTLATVRGRSSILTAAICTVTAFCTGSKDYQNCLKAFTNEVSRKLFSDDYEFDDVRALCIGAFWLKDISSALNGMAVRIATQLDLHRCITKMPHHDVCCFNRTRLHFVVYLCDHHCSLIYGRPPMTREFQSLKSPSAFVQSEFSRRIDLKLICQVELWSISRRVFDSFGADIRSSIVSQRLSELDHLNEAYDKWYRDWHNVINLEGSLDTSYQRQFDLYFHCAKLYLFSHVFRDPSRKQSSPDVTYGAQDSWAHKALDSAVAVLRCIVEEDETRQRLGMLPFYFATMVSFASVFVVKILSQDQEQFISNAARSEYLGYLERLVTTLRNYPIPESSTNPLPSIAKSLETLIAARRPSSVEQLNAMNDDMLSNMSFNFDMFANDVLSYNFPGDQQDIWMQYSREPDFRFLEHGHL